jgi:hypothetical protein
MKALALLTAKALTLFAPMRHHIKLGHRRLSLARSCATSPARERHCKCQKATASD